MYDVMEQVAKKLKGGELVRVGEWQAKKTDRAADNVYVMWQRAEGGTQVVAGEHVAAKALLTYGVPTLPVLMTSLVMGDTRGGAE